MSWSGSQARTGSRKRISRWCPCRGRCVRIRSLYKTETQRHVADDSIAGKLSRKSNHEPDRHEPHTVWRQIRRTSANPRFEHMACLGGFADVSERRRISSQDRDSGARELDPCRSPLRTLRPSEEQFDDSSEVSAGCSWQVPAVRDLSRVLVNRCVQLLFCTVLVNLRARSYVIDLLCSKGA